MSTLLESIAEPAHTASCRYAQLPESGEWDGSQLLGSVLDDVKASVRHERGLPQIRMLTFDDSTRIIGSHLPAR